MRKIYFLLSSVLLFLATTQKSSAQYCGVTFPGNVEPITLVNFNTINNSTSATLNGTPALEDFTTITTNVFKTTAYPITVKGNTDGGFTTYIDVYIDWNHDNDFVDAGENFFIGTITGSTGLDAIQASGDILVPAAALNGNTRMRVIKKYAVSAIPCNTSGFGQAEDYTINVLTLPPCTTPLGGGTATGPSGAVCSGNGVTVSIAGGSFGAGITYQWESSPDNSTWTPVGGATAASLITSATVSTYYRRKISCSGIDEFSTSVLISVSAPLALPFTENFAAYATTFPPTCWTSNSATAVLGVAQSAFGIGSGSAKFDFYNAFPPGTVLELGSPLFTAVPANYRLTFDHAYATYSGENDQLQILYSTNGGISYTNLILYDGGFSGPLNTGGSTTGVFAPTAAQWANKGVTLPVGTNKILFRGISDFGNNLFIDNVTVEPIPPCLPPTGLTTAAIAQTTTTLNWTASASGPSNGYQWEVRISGAPGSGAAGLTASGVTGAAVTTANATGLTANTIYSYYVRSDCGAAVFSTWTAPFVFTTLCNATNVPYTQAFDAAVSPAYPACLTLQDLNGATSWRMWYAGGIVAASAPNSIRYQWSGTTPADDWFFIQGLNLTGGKTYYLSFKYKGSDGNFGYVEKLEVKYGSSPQAAAMTSGTLFTNTNIISSVGDPFAEPSVTFTPAATGVYYIGFHAFSAADQAFLYVDDIKVESCPAPTNVSVISISPVSAIASFTSSGSAFIVEYGAPGFVPGTGNVAGTGGTLVPGTSSPININGLTPATNYDFYVRNICIPGVEYSQNVKVTASTLCLSASIPYLQNFESASVPGLPTCTSVQDVNGNSGSFWNGLGGGAWETYTDTNPLSYVSPSTSLLYFYDYNVVTRPADDWFYTQGLNLVAGTSYRLKFLYKAIDGVNYPEKLEVKYGTLAYAAGMTSGTLFTNNNITSVYGNAAFDSTIVDFTPSSTGVYYIGFHAQSDPDEYGILLDDISVKVSPKVDVGIAGITLPSLNCPTNGVFVQATIKNYNTLVQNFATYPVTVTANITGAAATTLTALVNSGTLAPGASMEIYLSPSFSFSAAGLYTITTATSSPDDPETGNDANTRVVNVNPNPATPVITPASPQLCIGGQVQLNTQFTASAPPVILPAVSSGTIAVAVPDASPAGITHTLAVNSVPVGATITGISVTINLTHTWISDMVINLKAPNGNVLNLFNRKGGSGDNLVNTVISSASAAPLAGGVPPFTGTFAADAVNGVGPTANQSNITSFSGLYSIANGNWTLAMRDLFIDDIGTLTSWSITITYQVLTPVVTWTPVTGLFTNATATTAYVAGANAYSVYSKPATTGTYLYTVTATTAAGCTATGSATVTVNAPTAITVGSIPDTVCTSDQVIPLVASPAGGSWTGIGVSGNNFIPPATAVGTYILTYTYTNSFGCTSTATKRIAVKDCPERIRLLRDNAVILYPNPNNGLFNIRINSVLYNYLTMKVYTNNGVLVRTQQLGGLAYSRVVPIDLTNLPGGVYMVHFYYEGGVRTSEKTFKVVIGLP